MFRLLEESTVVPNSLAIELFVLMVCKKQHICADGVVTENPSTVLCSDGTCFHVVNLFFQINNFCNQLIMGILIRWVT